jgi:hypothetical protein
MVRIPEKTKMWLKRIGWAGFFFFLVKGIVWLVAGKAILDWIRRTF